MQRVLWIAVPVLMFFLTGCPGGGSVKSNPIVSPVGLNVTPTSATMAVGGAQTFTATVTNSTNTAVTWSVQEGAAGGSIDSTGKYTAPNTIGTYHVIATSQADTTKTATATVTVHTLVAISPSSATLTLAQSQTFSATVTGSTNTAVTWTISEGAVGGMIDSTGKYTAPNAAGTFHVTATSQADGTQSSATVTVQAGSASGTIQ
jgi:uncharacterized protein YjdB